MSNDVFDDTPAKAKTTKAVPISESSDKLYEKLTEVFSARKETLRALINHHLPETHTGIVTEPQMRAMLLAMVNAI